ncbi:vanadium-dependent haloperoxidase [Streptomyces sp. DH12]|uniref:vanadium-dependent haloperoxidase n=1 Tax=Streptomyces sp. DH12 TaxID=2857010 RepID=UPI001E5E9015|nr:vanadium-dependent haloperoxidase [Streptomyces sp. DH12]
MVPRRVRAASALLLGLTALAAASAPSAAVPGSATAPAAAGSVVADWARTTAQIVDREGSASEEVLWHALVSVGVYNAVVGIEGRYEPYRWRERAPRPASAEAAAATAAHDILRHTFPQAAAELAAAHAASLARVPDGPAEDAGVAFGRRAARHVVDLRAGDGFGVQVAFPHTPGTGVWRPTPPRQEPFASAWLGRLRPLLLDRPDQFRPGPPPALSSARYAADFDEVKKVGAKSGSRRTPAQTATALFFTKLDLQGALADRATRQRLDLVDTARLYAAVNTVQADAVIAAWDAKLRYGSWRPVTAIHEAATDGNPHTQPDPAWQPLLETPAHPDYLSGHATTAGALTRTLTLLSGTPRLDLRITSVVARATRTYTHARDYDRDAVDARVWAGIHTRTADTVGNATGQRVAAWALTRYFRPVRG